MKKYLTGLLTFLVLGFFLVSARAASVETSAYLDWSNFSWMGFSFTGDSPTLTWISQGESIDLEAQENSYSQSADNWNDNLSYTITTPQIEVGAEAQTNSIKSYADASSADGYSRSGRWGKFQVSGSGLIVFTVPYRIEGKIEVDPESEFDHASLSSDVFMGVSLEDADSDVSHNSYSWITLSKYYSPFENDGDVGEWQENGTLVLAHYFYDGETWNFYVGTYAEVTSAPIPSSILLITSGIGLIFIRRRGIYGRGIK